MEDSTGQPLDDVQAQAPLPPPAASTTPQSRGPRPTLWVGVALVILGALLLVSQFTPGMEFWRWWPLVLVGLGIRQMFGRRHERWSVRFLGDGLTTIAFGLVLLGQMLGALRWDVWFNILRLWPVLFVSLGLEIIGKAIRAEWLRFLGSVVIVAALAYGALALTPSVGWPPVTRASGGMAFEHVEPHSASVTEGKADISGAVGELTVGPGEDLARISGTSPYDPVFDVSTRRGQATVVATAGEGSWMPMTPASELEVSLDRDVEWDLDIEAGVSEYEVDVSDLRISSLALESGVSSGVLTLGLPDASDARGSIPVGIDAGVSAIVVRIPRGAGARVVIDEGLSGVDAEGEWTRGRAGEDRTYESEDFSADGTYWDVRIQSGVGGITLQYY